MKVTQALKEELAQWLDTYWTTYLKGDIETWATFIRDDYRNIGGTKEEIWNSKQEIIDYTMKIMDQMLGTAEIRNREIEVIPYGEFMMVNEFTDLYVKIEGEWTFYGPFRMSSLLEKTDTGWIALHQHGSYPDMKAMEGEAFSMDALKAENVKLQEAVKSRTIELEIKNHELKIESALERVRSKALAMHNSNDISETISAAFEELKKLGIHSIRSGVGLLTEGSADALVYAATEAADGRIKALTSKRSMLDHPSLILQYEEWKKQADFEQVLTGDELISYYSHQFYQSAKDGMHKANPGVHEYGYYFSFEDGLFYSWSDQPYSEAEKKILHRFRSIIALTFRRYLDLQKAEAQTREARIEAALERTRTQSMLMQHSQQLDDTLRVFHEQVLLLGINSAFSFLWLPDEKNLRHIFWAAWAENVSIDPLKKKDAAIFKSKAIDYPLDKSEPATAQCLVDWNGKEPVVSYHVPPAGVVSYFAAWQELIAGVEHLKPEYFSDGLCYVEAFMKYGCFGVMVESELSDDEKNLLHRFAIEFERTYTRFLDLQKAEAQSREAQIQLALERVRAKTMAMQKSEDLGDCSFELVKQVQALGVATWHCAFNIYDKDQNSSTEWGSNAGGTYPTYKTPREGIFHKYYEVGQTGETIHVEVIGEDRCADHYAWLCKLPGVGEQLVKLRDSGISFPTSQIDHVAYFKYGYLLFITYEPVPEAHDIFLRFAKVFEQTYTRFLDLQKAEAQAKEAQIEAALERVRSRAMAMQKTEELLDAADLVGKELSGLGINSMNVSYAFVDESEKNASYYSVNPIDGKILPFPFVFPHTETEVMRTILSSWKRQEPFNVLELGDDATLTHQTWAGNYIKKLFDQKGIPFSIEEFLKISPQKAFISTFNFANGYLFNIGGVRLTAMQEDILLRITKVFDLTYRRFLDLKQAESQAREAQIELALERVRARTMAMQHSHELQDAAQIMFQQVQELGVHQWACGYNIWEDNKKFCKAWMSAEGTIQAPFKTPSSENVFLHFYEASLKGEDLYVEEISGEDCTDHYRFLSTLPVAGDVMKGWEAAGITHPKYQIFHIAYFKQGYLMFITYTPVPEAHDIFKRFAKVFEQTYTRFLDLQKAEAQALETVKRASVDRVRAEIASMRTTSDLEKITPLIWNELTTLGVPFIRCGVFIMDEKEQQVNTYLSNPEGKAIAAFHQPYNSPGDIAEVVKSWRKKVMYTRHWDEAMFVEVTKNLVQQGGITSGEKYLTENHPTDLYLHFLPFLQGMLYAGNTAPLSDDALQLVQNLADAFSTAYARYEDFNKLEAAKEQVDKTLSDLKQTQAQLVQAEKMASLGELTAGIAHEIQNPLNFVNNFSEINTELSDEILDAASRGDLEVVRDIANDMKSNQLKISEHGKRADSIVKSMLQHSRISSGIREPTDLNKLADEYLRLAYHGMRSKDKSFNAHLETRFAPDLPLVPVVAQDIGRVLLNLYNNAFYAVAEKMKQNLKGYDPIVVVTTKLDPEAGYQDTQFVILNPQSVIISVTDNGPGIPENVKEKIFQPFFTTKPTGQGTGLGLSLSYDIIKAHGGELKVETKEGGGSEFIIQLPIN